MVKSPQIRLVRVADAANGRKTGDRTGVGFFIPLPDALAAQYPSLGDEDKSPPHVTFLYVGEVPENRQEALVQAAQAVCSELGRPVAGHLDQMDYFVHPAFERRVAVQYIRFDQDLASLRWRLRDRLMDAGFKVDDSFPLVYRPHVTLAYMDGLDASYEGDVPVGDWQFNGVEIWGLPEVVTVGFEPEVTPAKVAQRKFEAMRHQTSVALMRFLSEVARRLGVAEHIYVVGGAVRNFVIKQPVKDVDVVVDSVALGGRDAEWFAKAVQRAIPGETNLTTNQYGVAILTIKDDWMVGEENLKGEVIEIATARKESYGEGGYKPDQVEPATIEEDTVRREFTFNTLMWRLLDLAEGPDKAEIIDLTGCGMKDLAEGVLKCPRDPDIVFADDPTRMLRAVRFAVKYGFRIPPDVEASIRKNAHLLKKVPPNAISSLLFKMWRED